MNIGGVFLMRKFLFVFLIFIFSGTGVFAEHLCAPLINIDTSDEIEISFTDEELPMLFSLQTEEEYIMSCFDAVLNPENISETPFYEGQDCYYVEIPMQFSTDITDFTQENMENMVDQKCAYVNSLFERYIAENPDYFYLITGNYGGYANINYFTYTLYFEPLVCYDFTDFDGCGKTLKAQYDEMQAKIASIAQELSFDGMSDLDKALLAHDYITDNCVYYLTYDENGEEYYGDGYSFNAYGVFVNRQAVCQGYAFAYAALLKELGISIDNIKQIRSDALEHQWNLIYLNNNWYHVDTTWDDPTGSHYDMTDLTEQTTRHTFFLISSETNENLRNKAFDMDVYGFDDSLTDTATSKNFESGYIFNSTLPEGGPIYGAISYSDGKYIFETDYKLYSNSMGKIKFITDTLCASDYLLSQPYFSKKSDNIYYYTAIDSLTELNGNVCFRLFSGNADANITKQKSFILCFYDIDGRLLKNVSAKTSNTTNLNTFSSANFPPNTYSFKVFCLDDLTPLSNTIILTR